MTIDMRVNEVLIRVYDANETTTILAIVGLKRKDRLMVMLEYQSLIWPEWQTHKKANVAAAEIMRAVDYDDLMIHLPINENGSAIVQKAIETCSRFDYLVNLELRSERIKIGNAV